MTEPRTDFRSTGGYLAASSSIALLDTTSSAYAADQLGYQSGKATRFLVPILRRCAAESVIDIGCGIGAMVETLLQQGFDAYGVDVAGTERLWLELGRPRDRFIVVDPIDFALPLEDRSVDFAYTLGVIEHVGTRDGHADRRADYEDVRRRWLAEIFRVLRIGGHLLIGGPNRGFPVDAAHGPDMQANRVERWLHHATGLSIHRTWGQHFLWSFSDLRRNLAGLQCSIEPLSVAGLIDFGRVPALLAPMAKAYVGGLPRALLGTGLNPWTLALVKRTG